MKMNRLRYLRESRGISRNELAETLGIKPRTYLSYENMEREPNSETLILLADFFDVTIDYLLERTENPDGVYTTKIETINRTAFLDSKKLTTIYNKLNILGKQKVSEYIEDIKNNSKYTTEKSDKQETIRKLLEEMEKMNTQEK